MEEAGREFSGQAAHRYVGEILSFHRIQASPGYRRAAEYAYESLSRFGLRAEILSYPAREGVRFWGQPSFQEWEAEEGVLRLVEPEGRMLADYHHSRLSLIQRSGPFQGQGELVLLEDGLAEAEYAGLNLAGKVVLTKGEVSRVHYLAVERGGAVGIIYDGMRELPGLKRPSEAFRALQYASFWWYGGEKKCFGFVLPPQEGERLRQMVRSRAREGKPPPKVEALVRGRFWDGSLEVVSALIPGESDEEVVVVAHLCHPQGFANDNASGAATLMEVARALHRLAARIHPPRRSIRFLLVPEMTGTYAYLSSQEERLPKMIAGLNLDMVGEDQERCGSSLLLERVPEASASFTVDLLARLLEEMAQEAPGYAGAGGHPSFRYGSTPFSGGSDHVILSDPSVAIPTPLLIQWPDRFYHTSLDSWEKVDPEMLSRVGKMAATYAYFLATAGEREALWLGREMLARFKSRVVRTIQEGWTEVSEGKERGWPRLVAKVEYLLERERQALRSLKRLAPVKVAPLEKEAASFIKRELAALPQTKTGKIERPGGEGLKVVPWRLHKGPLPIEPYLSRLTHEEREGWWQLSHPHGNALWYLLPQALFWADGKRTLGEIVDLVEMETGKREPELLEGYCRLLDKLGLLELRE